MGPGDAIVVAGLRSRKATHPLALHALPVSEALQPRAFLLDVGVAGAERMRIVQAFEEGERIADLVEAEVELRDAAECEIEIRRVARREDFACGKGESRGPSSLP